MNVGRFQVLADNIDVTAAIADRLISLRLSDEAGFEADLLEIELDDRGSILELPETGAVLDIALNKGGVLIAMGRFVVDQLSGRGAPDTLRITATAADMSGTIRAPRTRAYEGQTIGSIANHLASRNGLTATVSPQIGAQSIGYVAQTAESDLHFVTRMVRQYGGTAKIAGGRLIISTRGAAERTDGVALEPAKLRRNQLSDFNWHIDKREEVGRATADWHDQAGGARQTVSAGAGEPVVELRHVYATQVEASRAAQAQVDAGSRQLASFSAGIAGFRPDLFAEAPIEVSDVRDGIDGRWILTRVEHVLRKELKTRIDAERALTP